MMKNFKLHMRGVLMFCLPLLLPAVLCAQESDSLAARVTKNRLRVESIEISGNSKTRPGVILSWLDFSTGELIDARRLENNRRRLRQTNFFKAVDLYTQPGSGRGKIRVFVEVKERRWPYFQVKGGYSQLDGWYISPLGIRFDNLFGRGNFLGAELLIGDRVSGLDFSYLRPYIFATDLNFGVRLFSRKREFVHFPQGHKFLQNVYRGGLRLQLNGNHGLMKYLWFEYVAENVDADSFMWRPSETGEPVALPPVVRPFAGTRNVSHFVVSLVADTRDNRLNPVRGWWASLSLTQVSRQFGAFADYKIAVLDVRRYQPLPGNGVLAIRLKGGRTDENAPFYERFYLGGPNSLRGYPDRSLTPLGYASRLVQGSVELRFPITRRHFPYNFLGGVFFYDFGQAWNAPDKLRLPDFYTGAGFGFRFKLPIIGIVRLDFAYPIPTYEFRLHLSLGHTF